MWYSGGIDPQDIVFKGLSLTKLIPEYIIKSCSRKPEQTKIIDREKKYVSKMGSL